MKYRTVLCVLTAAALGLSVSTVGKSSAEETAPSSSTPSGLSFSAVPSAFYVRQGDQLRQVVLVSCRPDGVGGSVPRERSLSISGDRTIVDAAHLLGFDHKKFTYRYAGRDFRLTDVEGHVVRELVA